jgi:hypothetical protein
VYQNTLSAQYQLIPHTFPSFQTGGNTGQSGSNPGQSGSNTSPRFNPPQETPFHYGGPSEDFGQQQFQCLVQQTSRPRSLQNRQTTPVVTPVRTNTPRGTICFKCGKVGHYAIAYPKSNSPDTLVQSQHSQQMRNVSQIPKGNKGKQSYARGGVNHVSAETAQENPRVVFGMCLVNSVPASVVFDAGSAHSFITSQCAAKLNVPVSIMPRPMLVSSAKGNVNALHRCNNVNL